MSRKVILFTLSLFTVFSLFSQSKEQKEDLRLLSSLLDYVSVDYANAVKDGKVINAAEYAEQKSFSKQCIALHQDLVQTIKSNKFTALKRPLDSLYKSIVDKKKAQVISDIATTTKNKILALGIIKISPRRWPSIKLGKELYQINCASCHGRTGKGDGPAGLKLDPVPINLRDSEIMDALSPLQAYNVIRLGVQGTAMMPFNELTEDQMWDLAFYAISIRHDTAEAAKEIPSNIHLEQVSKWSDLHLRNFLSSKHSNLNVGAVRNYEPKHPAPLSFSLNMLKQSYKTYQEGDYKLAGKQALKSYLEGVELVENILPRDMVRSIESNMLYYRKAIKKKNDKDVSKYYNILTEEINSAKTHLSEIDYSFAFIYGASLSILIREALEALLIILVVLSILKPLKIKNAVTAVHLGWIVALICGLISWFLVGSLINLSGANREVMEGIGSIIAVIVLLYAGTWLHSHSEISKWTGFIKGKINKISESGNWIGLSLFSFIVVFREAFEVILFLSSLKLNNPQTANSALIWALVTAAVIIVIIAILFMKYTKKLPLNKIFKFSANVIAILTIVLAGKGIHALQEAGYIFITPLHSFPQIDILGIYPNVQALAGQIVILGIIILFSRKNIKKQTIKAEKKVQV